MLATAKKRNESNEIQFSPSDRQTDVMNAILHQRKMSNGRFNLGTDWNTTVRNGPWEVEKSFCPFRSPWISEGSRSGSLKDSIKDESKVSGRLVRRRKRLEGKIAACSLANEIVRKRNEIPIGNGRMALFGAWGFLVVFPSMAFP